MNIQRNLSIGLMGLGLAWVIAAGVFLVEPMVCQADTVSRQLTLDASLSTPCIHRDRTQTVYLRIGLTGFDLEPAGKRAPVNLGLVIDRSGSMGSEGKLEKAKEAAIMVIRRLDREDIVSIVMYDSMIQVLVPATKVRDKEYLIDQIRRIGPGGSTALYAGVQAGAEEMRKFLSGGRVNRMLLLSDGLANVGPQSPAELGNLGGATHPRRHQRNDHRPGAGVQRRPDVATGVSQRRQPLFRRRAAGSGQGIRSGTGPGAVGGGAGRDNPHPLRAGRKAGANPRTGRADRRDGSVHSDSANLQPPRTLCDRGT